VVSPIRFDTLFLAAFLATAGGGLAHADGPTPAAIDAARRIVVGSGMTRSFDLVIPEMMGELDRNVTATRPDISDSLHATLKALVPEFVRSEQAVVDGAAQALAKRMSEQELKDPADFFNSPSGKKYVETEPLAYNDIVAAVQAWRQKLSVDVLARAREEMKKKGVEF
jgi:hypothetical protein